MDFHELPRYFVFHGNATVNHGLTMGFRGTDSNGTL